MDKQEQLYEILSMDLYWDFIDKLEKSLDSQFSSVIDEQSLDILSGIIHDQLFKIQNEELIYENLRKQYGEYV